MRLIRIRYVDPVRGPSVRWEATERAAHRFLLDTQDAGPPGTSLEPATVDRVDVPTDRAGLLAWLNAHGVDAGR